MANPNVNFHDVVKIQRRRVYLTATNVDLFLVTDRNGNTLEFSLFHSPEITLTVEGLTLDPEKNPA